MVCFASDYTYVSAQSNQCIATRRLIAVAQLLLEQNFFYKSVLSFANWKIKNRSKAIGFSQKACDNRQRRWRRSSDHIFEGINVSQKV